MNAILLGILLSMTPVGELRAGLPAAFIAGVNPWIAYAVCVIANAFVAPICFVFLEYIHYHFLHVGMYRTAFDKFMERTRQRTEKYVQKYGYFGLALFVAVPLPLTGAYTGALAAWFFGMNKWKAFIAILLGVAVAGAIVLAVLLTGNTAWQWVKA
jgi:uncharacterized membrane protein